jgi:hypothetical protein
MTAVRTRRRPDNEPTMWRAHRATPIGAPADGLCADCSRAILRGDTIRVNPELRVVHWDCWHRNMEWRARVFDDLVHLGTLQSDKARAQGSRPRL